MLVQQNQNNNCKICNRELGNVIDEHHWVPRTFKGKEKDFLHKICHRKLHSVFTEREMLHYYNTVERCLEHEDMKKFVKWVQKKPINFYDSSKDTNIRKGKRRR